MVALLLSFQTRLLLTLMAALVLGVGLALFTMRKILKLEGPASLQYVEVAEARTQLKALSARLVQTQETERRHLSRELHDEVGQARESSKRTGMDVTVAAELDSDELPDEYKTCIYRVVQEALHYCARHSEATPVRIRGDKRLIVCC